MPEVNAFGPGLLERRAHALVGDRIQRAVVPGLVHYRHERAVGQQGQQFPAHVMQRTRGLVVVHPDAALHGHLHAPPGRAAR